MQFEPTPDQIALIHRAIANGRYRTVEEALHDAMGRWEANERARLELAAALDEAEADVEDGRYRDYTDETLPQLAEELKQEARAERSGKLG